MRQLWIVTVRYWPDDAKQQVRRAVVGTAGSATVEAAMHLVALPEALRAEVRADAVVRKFVDGDLDPGASGYYSHPIVDGAWSIGIGAVHEVLP